MKLGTKITDGLTILAWERVDDMRGFAVCLDTRSDSSWITVHAVTFDTYPEDSATEMALIEPYARSWMPVENFPVTPDGVTAAADLVREQAFLALLGI